MDDANIIPIEIISGASFKDSKVLIEILKRLHQLHSGFKFENDEKYDLPIRFESLLMFAENVELHKLAKELGLKFNRILSYNSITKKFGEKCYLPYELISHPKVENLVGIYKPSSTNES